MPPTPHVTLLDLLEEVGTATLPPVDGAPGREVPIRPCTNRFMRLFREFEAMDAGEAADARLLALTRLAVPDATEAELDEMTGRMMLAVVYGAQHKLDLVLKVLAARRAAAGAEGNARAPGVVARPRPRRSRSTTASRTRSRA